jgi:hypothetical protein
VQIIDDIGKGFGNVAGYIARQGVFSIAITVGTLLLPLWGTAILAAGSAALMVVQRLSEQNNYQKEMLKLYRDEIANTLGIDVKQVNLEHLRQVAYGDSARGIEGNPVLAQALDRQKSKSWLTFGTAIAAGAAIFGILQFTPAADIITNFFNPESFGAFGSAIGFMSTGIISTVTSFFVQQGMEKSIGVGMGTTTLSAHDRILTLDKQQSRGKPVAPEQVFDVFMAANPKTAAKLVGVAGEKYQKLSPREKRDLMQSMGVTNLMQQLAQGISSRQIDATELAFIAQGAQPMRVRIDARSAQNTPQVAAPQETREPRRGGFVERLNAERARSAAVGPAI